MPLPVFYSFRRCPYAMRARLAILLSGQTVALREIILKNKPTAMLQASPKGTVPVLILPDQRVIEESLEIMQWALTQSDPKQIIPTEPELIGQTQQLIHQNDVEFKPWLDKYKYADRFPEYAPSVYRQHAESFIQSIETRLTQHSQLIGQSPSLADYAIFPFIRQFAQVDINWFNQAPYPHTKKWLTHHLDSPLFSLIMKKYPLWQETQEDVIFK